jgi:hypothetical protein
MVREAPIKGDSSPMSRVGAVPSIRIMANHTAGMLTSTSTMMTRIGLSELPFLFNNAFLSTLIDSCSLAILLNGGQYQLSHR